MTALIGAVIGDVILYTPQVKYTIREGEELSAACMAVVLSFVPLGSAPKSIGLTVFCLHAVGAPGVDSVQLPITVPPDCDGTTCAVAICEMHKNNSARLINCVVPVSG